MSTDRIHRTTIVLPDDLKERAQRQAQERGVSLAALIRDALESHLAGTGASAADDPMLSDRAVWTGESPRDLAARHDDYLYADEP
jgi:hypothetical protein